MKIDDIMKYSKIDVILLFQKFFATKEIGKRKTWQYIKK